MYKQLKNQLDDKSIIEEEIKGISNRITYKLQKQLGLKATNYSDAKLEIVAMGKNDKFINAFASVEKLDKELNELKGEKKIIEESINKISKSIDGMDDTEKKVFKCRYILGLSRRATAERLSFSEDRIKQISREITKKMQDYPFITPPLC